MLQYDFSHIIKSNPLIQCFWLKAIEMNSGNLSQKEFYKTCSVSNKLSFKSWENWLGAMQSLATDKRTSESHESSSTAARKAGHYHCPCKLSIPRSRQLALRKHCHCFGLCELHELHVGATAASPSLAWALRLCGFASLASNPKPMVAASD